MSQQKKGFTLIELLVVIAIIGILSSIVLASLNTARNRGNDAAIKSNLANARSQAQLYYESNGSSYGVDGNYTAADGSTVNVCNLAATASGLKAMFDQTITVSGSGNVKCIVSGTGSAWVMAAKLKSDSAKSWCVDSGGQSKEGTTLPEDGASACL